MLVANACWSLHRPKPSVRLVDGRTVELYRHTDAPRSDELAGRARPQRHKVLRTYNYIVHRTQLYSRTLFSARLTSDGAPTAHRRAPARKPRPWSDVRSELPTSVRDHPRMTAQERMPDPDFPSPESPVRGRGRSLPGASRPGGDARGDAARADGRWTGLGLGREPRASGGLSHRSVKHPISPQLFSSSGASGGEGRQSMGRPDFWTGAGKAGEAGANSFPRHDGQLGRWLSARRSERGHGHAAAESGATDGALRGRGVLHAPHDRRARERDAGSIRRLRAGFVSALRHRRACRPHDSRITRAPHQSNYAAHLWSN